MGAPSAPDDEILARAREQQFALITNDLDFLLARLHGRTTTTTNGTRAAVFGSCSGEGQQRQRRGWIASRVRSRAGAAGRTRMFRARTEAAIPADSMRDRT
ncbi:MAG: DUF5615 family PIN-like protein [Acidobacteria bacterium]|nr:DUF5615 family PIN-like protein [Acidobacteriota bacterium]